MAITLARKARTRFLPRHRSHLGKTFRALEPQTARSRERNSKELAFGQVPIYFFRIGNLTHGPLAFSRSNENLVFENSQFHDLMR